MTESTAPLLTLSAAPPATPSAAVATSCAELPLIETDPLKRLMVSAVSCPAIAQPEAEKSIVLTEPLPVMAEGLTLKSAVSAAPGTTAGSQLLAVPKSVLEARHV